MYEYNAVVTAVHDGDTITVNIDLGFGIWFEARHLRLAGVSARELSMPGGPAAAQHLAQLLPPGTPVVIRSLKQDADPQNVMSLSRYVVKVTLAGHLTPINLDLINDGWAASWDGRSKPVPYPDWPIPGVTG